MKYCILLLVVATALGVPIIQDAEDVQCNSLFQYKKEYVFNYIGTTETGIVGTHDVTSNTRITCDHVVIRVPQKCVVVLNIGQCEITPATDQTRAFAQNLERYELMAHVSNGLMIEVLPHVDETMEVLNVKKGILSALQMEWTGSVQEELVSDQLSIHGNCSATTTHVPNSDEFTEEFLVTRDLSSCTQKPFKTPLLWSGLAYLQNMSIGSNLLNSSQQCRYETYDIKGQHMQRAECKEVHSFWPMSISNDRGIMTTVTQVLEQQDLQKLNSLDFKALRYDKRSTNIVQEIPKVESTEELSVDEAMAYIKDLVKSTIDEVKMDTPRKFGYWVKALRSLNNDTIHEVFEKTFYCEKYSDKCANTVGKPELAREYLWDGLIQCGTLPCFSVVNTAIIKNIIPKPLAHVMMYTMAFRDYPTLDIISEAVRVAQFNRTRSIFLPVSTMIYKYWLDHPEIHNERELPVAIQEFIELLNNIINNDCTLNSDPKSVAAVEEERQILLAIKALGNLGPVAQKYDASEFRKRLHFERELLKCAINEKVSYNISLNAVQALRRFNMSIVSNFVINNLKVAFLNVSYDVEVRIAAYLIYMKSDIKAPHLISVYEALKNEPVKQFKAFTYSHMSNILESEDPSVQSLRKELALAIGETEFPEYPKNILKYSSNIEISKILTIPYFNKTFGGSIESNLIFNPEALMPKSLMLKSAINAMGKEWELIETGLDVQGFEVILESVFGPAGFFPNNMMQSMFRGADELIMSRVRNASLPLNWLASVMDIIMSNTPLKDLQAAGSQAVADTKDHASNLPKSLTQKVPVPEPEPLPENGLDNDIQENLANMHDVINKEQKERIASIYLRILGNELGYVTLDDIKSLIPVIDKQMLEGMVQELGLKLTEGVDLNTTRSILFLERELVLPTGLGMPLNCSANGSLVLSVRTRGQLSIQLPSATVSGRLAPSAGIEILGTMGVHIPTTKMHAGVMANASMYHSSNIEGNVTIDGPKLKVQVKALDKPMNLLNFSVNYFLLKPNGEMSFIPGIMEDAVKYQQCANAGKILGASLCMSFAYPNASYAEIAPRFPLTGPLSFNITLNNTDQTLGAYTFVAEYAQVVKGGAKPSKVPHKKSFGSIGKSSTYVPPEEVIDMITVNFTAPGDSIRRDVMTVLSFHRNKTEAKWSFDIPELNGLQIFAGLLNISDKTTGETGMHLVWNATYNEMKSSVSFTVKNSTMVGKTNYTAVFNASVEKLHYATVMQHINTGSFMITSMNETYYWDDETPIYEQLSWPVSGYAIKPEKYRTSVGLLKSLNEGPRTDTTLFISSLGQNFTVESVALSLPESYTNEITSKFENTNTDLPLVDFSYQYDKAVRMGVKETYRYIDVHRGDYALFYQEDGEKVLESNTMSRNYTFGAKATNKVLKKEFSEFGEKVLEKFGDEAYDIKPVNFNTTLHFYFNNETISAPSYFTALNVTSSVPTSLDLTNQTRWGLGFTARLMKELSTPEKTFGYVLQLNNTIPFLLLDFSNEVRMSNSSAEGFNVSFSHQTLERKYGKHMNIDMFNLIDIYNMSLKNGFNFTSPYYNYSGGFVTVMDDIYGLVIKNQIGQKGVLLPNITDFLTDYYFTMKMWQNSSLGFHLTHKLINISTDHLIQLDGPVTNFSLSMVPFFMRDLLNKTYHSEFEAIKTTVLEVSYNITNSSLTVGNDLYVSTPYIMNVSMDHDLVLDMNRVNHSLIVMMKRPSVNFNVEHLLQGPDDSGVFTVNTLVSGNLGTFSELATTVTGKAKYGKSLNSNLVLSSTMKTPKIANVTMGGSFIIKGMKDYTKFDVMEFGLDQEVESILGYSYLIGTAKFDTFKRLFKFSKSEAGIKGIFQSRFLNYTSESGIEASGFNDYMEFDRLNTSSAVNVTSPFMSFNINSSSEINNVEGILVASKIRSINSYHLDSVIGNADYSFGYDISDISSPLDFQKINGSSGFNITSRMVNVTTTNGLDFTGVRNIFSFDKVNGSMSWNVTSMLGNGLMSQRFELNNFQNLTFYDSAIAEMNYAMSSKYLGAAQLVQSYGIYESEGLLTFGEANSTIEGSVTSSWINSSLTSFGKIKKMKGLLHSNTVLGRLNYETTSRLFNMSGNMFSSTKGMDGLFKFKNIINSLSHESSTPVSNMTMDISTKWVSASGFMMHELATNTLVFNITTPIGSIGSNISHISENSEGPFQFDLTSLKVENALISRFLNMSSAGSMLAKGFESWNTFSELTITSEGLLMLLKYMNSSVGMTTSMINMNGLSFDKFYMTQNATSTSSSFAAKAMQETNINNLRGIFDFDVASTMGAMNIENRYINFTNGMITEMLDSRKFLDFDSLRFGASTNFSLPILVLNNSVEYEILGMRKLVESEKIAAAMKSSLKSKLLSVDTAAGYELLGQNALFRFERASMGANMSLSTPVVNMSTAVGSEMTDSKALFNYTTFKMGGSGSVNATIVSMKAEAGVEMLNQTSLLRLTEAHLRGMMAVTSKLANMTLGTEVAVLGHDKFMHFDLFSHNATLSFVSEPETMEQRYQATMMKSTGLFRSELFEVRVNGNNTGLINSTNKFRYAVSGNAGLFIFDELHLNNVMDLNTRYVNATSTNVFSIMRANGLLTFTKGVGTTGTVVNTPVGELEVIGSVNMDDFKGFMNFTYMAMSGKVEAGKLLTGMAGAEFVNFEGPFVFERMNVSSSLETINFLVNYTGDMVVEALNGKGLFNISKALFTTSYNITTALVNETTLVHLEANDVESLTKFSRAFLTNSYEVKSLVANGTSLVHLEANDVESLTNFTKANATIAWDVKTSVMNTTSGSTLLISNVRSIFDFDLISLVSKTDLFSKPANVTTGLLYALKGVTGFLKFDEVELNGNATAETLIGNMDSVNGMSIIAMDGLVKLGQMNMNTLTTVSGPLGLMQVSGEALWRNVLNVTSFKILTSQYDMKVFSKPLNVTSNGFFHVEASRNIFDVALLEGNMVHNISTPYTSTNVTSSLQLQQMAGLNSFDEIILHSEIKMRTPLTDSQVVLSMAGESSWGNVVETLATTLITSKGSVEIAQLIDYENAKVSITIPSYGYIHLHGHLNEVGDEMTIKMKHMLESKTTDLVEDFSLFVKLNQSDVIYTNFSWNPEVIAELMDISTDALNRTINFTMTLVNQTRDSYEKVMSLSYQKLAELNITVNEIIQNPRDFLEKYVNVTLYDEINDKLMEIVEFTRENPKEALKNVYDVVKATTEQAVNITLVTYGKLDERYMLQEKIDKVNKTMLDIIFYITYPKETWELVKPKLEEVLATVKESIKYDLISAKFNEIVDVPKLNLTIRKQLKELNRENLMMFVEEMKLLINTTKFTEAIDELRAVEINVGCVTFKDLADIDMETINSTYIKIKELLMLDNLKQFINISQVEMLIMQVNQTLKANLDLEAWNETIRSYVDIPLLNATMLELADYIKEEVNATLEDLKNKANEEVEKMKIRYEEFKVIVQDALQGINDTLMEVSGMNWPELKEKVCAIALQFNQTVYENIDTTKIQEILQQLKQNVTSRINMTKVDLAIEKLNTTLQVIINATRNETHPINILPVMYFDTTIFDFVDVTVLDFLDVTWVKAVDVSDVYGEKAFELTKEYGQKAVKLYQIYRVRALVLYKHYSNITIEKSMELYTNATILYEIYSVKLIDLVQNVSEIAVNKTEEWQIVIIDYVEKANQTLQEKYEEYYPIVSEFVSSNTEKSMIIVQNITSMLVEKSKPYAVQAIGLLTRYKNDILLQSSDVCINITTFIDDTIEMLPEYQQLMLNLTEQYTELSKDLIMNVTIYANKTLNDTAEKLKLLNEWRIETMDMLIEITKNEGNLLNYYPVEWTGKTVNTLSQETWETVKVTMEQQLEQLKLTTNEKLALLEEILADKTHSINKYPIELLGMSVFEIYEDVKQNVTVLVDQGKEYIEVVKVFIDESVITINETLIEYDITLERLNDTVLQVVTLMNETLIDLKNWIEVAKDQPLNLTIEQIVEFANKTALQALDFGNQTLIKTVEVANKTLIISIELWNNLTSQENLDKIPIYVENVVTFLNETFIQVNETIQDTIVLTKKAIEYLREETGLVEKLEEYKEKVEELRLNITKFLEKTKDSTIEVLLMTKDTVVFRSTGYVEYLNNTLPGWMYRYYKVEALPFQLWNYTSVKGAETIIELSNTTKVFVQEFVSRFVHFSIDSNSLTVNFSHPFNWTSFRSLPTLTDAQIEALVITKDEIVTRLILPSKYQIERLAELIKDRYEELMTYITSQIEENRPKIEEKLSELRQKIKETRQQIEEMRAEFNWTEFKENVTMTYQEAREYVEENYPVIMAELKANVTRAIEDIKVNYPTYIIRVKEIAGNITEQLKKYQEEFPETVSQLLAKVADLTRDLYLPTDLPPLVKPWTYTGMIFGTGHVMTFDGHVYEFPSYEDSACTYVLARDFVDGNFTLLVKELSTTLVLKTCTVTVDDKGLFFINGNPEPQSPPFVTPSRDVIVTRDGPWINVTTTYGIELKCHEDHFMCIYRLSGWYYSKTQGLLGNLDTEHFNEFTKPDGTVTTSLIDFANSYEVSGLAECQIVLPEDAAVPDLSCYTADQNSLKAECEAAFNQELSYLTPIFDIINPEPFLEACRNNAEKCRPTVEMVNPYINLARVEGVFVDIPGCADPVRTEPCTYSRPPVTTADIVFVISESASMTNGISEEDLKMNLGNLYISIRSNYPDSNFAMVAFGGRDYDHCAPHLHSNEMESFTNINFGIAVQSLEFCEDEESCPCSPRKGDALKAIKYASQLALRPSAGKIFILIDADNNKEYLDTERDEAVNTLSNNGITFNVISNYNRLEKTIGKVPIIGVNYDGSVLFNKRSSAESITEVLDTPKGTYAKLATATDGAMMHIAYVKEETTTTDLKLIMKKLFRTQLVSYAEKTVVCKSVRDYYGRPSSLCAQI